MNETQQIENFLFNKLTPQEKLVMEARLLINTELHDKAHWQKNTYQLLKQYNREKLKKEIEAVTTKIFTEKEFTGFRKKNIPNL